MVILCSGDIVQWWYCAVVILCSGGIAVIVCVYGNSFGDG